MAYNVNKDLVMGDDLFLYIYTASTAITAATDFTSANTEVLAFATSCSLQIDGETIDTSNKMSCRWNSNLAGKNSYTVSADALYTDESGHYSFDALLADMVAGDAIGWVIAQPTSGSTCEGSGEFYIDNSKVIAYGEGLITSLSLNAGNNEAASCSITITGSGELHVDAN